MSPNEALASPATKRGASGAEAVLVLHLNRLVPTRRVRRQIEILASRFRVIAAAFDAPSDLPASEFIELPEDGPGEPRRTVQSAARAALRLAGSYERAYWRDARTRRWRQLLLAAPEVRAVIVNDLFGLPLGFAVARRAPVVFDAHEHWSSESASWDPLQRLSMRGAHAWLVDGFIERTEAMMTVSPGIAEAYRERWRVSPTLITNAPPFVALSASRVDSPIRLVHVGMADARRRLEDTIDAVRLLDRRFTLDLILAGDRAYRARLERYASSDPRIRILPPVAPEELVRTLNRYDVGVFLLPGDLPNFVHVLPNKLFDYIQARLAVAIGPSPEMARVVRTWECGVVSPSFEPRAFAETVAALDAGQIAGFKEKSDRAAHELCAERNREAVIEVVRSAIERAGTHREALS